MSKKAKAKIFLAQERGLNGTSSFSSSAIFNFGQFFHEHKQPFGNIYLVNDDSLDAGVSLEATIEKKSYLVLLPVMGAIAVKDAAGKDNLLAAGQLQIISSETDETIRISNPFKEGIVNFLQIGIKAGHTKITGADSISDYNINGNHDNMLKISPDEPGSSRLPFTIFIGKFNGRGETILPLKNKSQGAFAFVIEGAFEVQGRLLHAGDALALWDTTEVEIEAFSNQAILLIIEQSFGNTTQL
jgi:quercetin 2,3-dioxygenase